MSQPTPANKEDIMRHTPQSNALSSTSALEVAKLRPSLSIISLNSSAAPASTRQSSTSSLSSLPSTRQTSTTSLRSSLKSSKSVGADLNGLSRPNSVRFVGLEPELELEMPSAKPGSPLPPPRAVFVPSALPQTKPEKPLRRKLSKRFSAPSPSPPLQPSTNSLTRKESTTNFSRPRPSTTSVPTRYPGSRATSFQSTTSTKSAPTPLYNPSASRTPNSSSTPQQYNPLANYIPCQHVSCSAHYLPSLLGLTFYSPQKPYNLTRKRSLCPKHANMELRRANEQAKRMWESMRQNAGRKTMGMVAAEFEIWVQEFREERQEESERLEIEQKKIVLRSEDIEGKAKAAKSKKKTIEQTEDEDWDWKYSPRPCTKKDCQKSWYSTFDAPLYLFYTTPRRSGFLPLATLCPTCARADVEELEDRIESKGQEMEAQAWKEWTVQVQKDRIMELDFWEKAQERVVREKGHKCSAVEEKTQDGGQKAKKSEALKAACIVM